MNLIPKARLFTRGTLILAGVLALASTATAQSPVPTFSKTFEPATIGPGSVSTLRFTIGNSTAAAVGNLAFTDILPAGVTIADPPRATSNCGASFTLGATAGGGTVSLSGGRVGAVGSCFVRVDVTSSTPGTHVNTSGDLTSDAGNSGTATAALTVATDRPGFSKSFSPDLVFFGGRSRLTFTIDNSANAVQMYNLTFTDTLPTGMVIASPANAAKTCGGGLLSAPAGGTVISYGPNFAVLPPDARVAAGATCTIGVDVVGNAVGDLVNITGELTSTPNGSTVRSSGKASAALAVSFEKVVLTKSFTDDPAPPGGEVTLQFTVRNLDRGFDATGIAFTDDLDATLSGLVAVGLPIAACGGTVSGTDVVTFTGGSVGPSGTCTFSVTLQVPAGADAGSYLNTTSAIAADVDGEAISGEPATDLLFIEPAPILTKSFVDDPVGAGGTVVLEFTLTNTSPSASATDIAFTDVFVPELPTASAVPAAGFCGPGSTATFTPSGGFSSASLAVAGANLGPGGTCSFSITLDVAVGAAAGFYPNVTSEVTATVDGASVTGNPASDNLLIVAAPSLTKEFTDDPAQPGGMVTLEFTLTHDENAPADATDISFTDDLDAALSGLVATGLPLADPCGAGSQLSGTMTLLFTGGTLAPGESCTFSVTLNVPGTAASGSHTNTTSAVVATIDGVEAMANPASDDLRIAGLTLSKEFTDDPVLPGGAVTLEFTIANISAASAATGIAFTDNLDTVIDNLMATGLPLVDPCGTGSSLAGTSGNTFLSFTGGSLAAGESCTFSVVLQVPAGAAPDAYANRTSAFRATVEGETVFFENATDDLVVASNFLSLNKQFIDDPVSAGDPVTLRFTLLNLNVAEAVADIAFTDDLDAALPGLVATGLPIAACGGTVSGTSSISFTGGMLAAGGNCTFDVTLIVPAGVLPGTAATNVTSGVTGTVGGLDVTGDPATDTLRIDFLNFEKSFGSGTVPGGTVALTFFIQNLTASGSPTISRLSFEDDLAAVIPGLAATGLPATDVCGAGSVLDGTTVITLIDGNLLPGGSCTFSVDLLVPPSALAGSYLNVTSDLRQFGIKAADPATASLNILAVVDADNDGVLDDQDVCLGTVIPEGVPTQSLGTNRYALVDGDLIFDTTPPKGNGPQDVFTTTDTGGCSCEQIIAALGLGEGHTKFGCSLGAMRNWVALVSSIIQDPHGRGPASW